MSNQNNIKKQPKGEISKFFSYFLAKKSSTISVLRLQGVISSTKGALKSGLSLDLINEDIEEAFSCKNITAVALIINSPGGSPVQSELIYNRIRSLSIEKNIPVISFAEDVAASGGYWLLLAGDKLFASNNSIIGSIGVVSSGFGFTQAIDKLGIQRRIYTQGKNKSVLDPFLPVKEEDVDILRNIQHDIHQSFIELVKERRAEKLSTLQTDLIFNGEFWSGRKAKELGLIDEIGDMYQIMRQLYGEQIKFKKIGKSKFWLKRKLGIERLDLLIDKVINSLVEAAIWQKFGL